MAPKYVYSVTVYPSWLLMAGLDYPPETHVRIERPADVHDLRTAYEDYRRALLNSIAWQSSGRTSGLTTVQQAEALHRYLKSRNPYSLNMGMYETLPKRPYTVSAGVSSDPS